MTAMGKNNSLKFRLRNCFKKKNSDSSKNQKFNIISIISCKNKYLELEKGGVRIIFLV